ncbi:response regulator [Paenibacillus sp. DS2015]|uniref:response regulator n=1 Tax=Paenibacillus sp. DS2015 TaxID=3373917 RepID=UPI003D1A8137
MLIVDDDALIREGLSLLLGLEEDFEVIGTAANAQEALERCRHEPPDLVLMDIRMPVMDGVMGTRAIKQQFRDIKVVILTTFRDDEYIKEAVKSGAEGYILKNQPSDSIIESLRAVGKGNTVFVKEVANTLSAMLKEEKQAHSHQYSTLTPREVEIMSLVAEGLSNKEIAEQIFLGEGTTRNYVTGLLEKLGLRDRTQLAIYYLKHL